MSEPVAHGQATPTGSRLGLILLVSLLAFGTIAGLAWWKVRKPRQGARETEPVELVTPYRNARPGVAYVGDAECARCHSEIAKTFANHSMGRSIALVQPESAQEGRFEAQGYRYEILRDGDRLIHRETRLDSEGTPVASVEAEVKYVLGSGTRGSSFLIDRGGALFQSPISYYGEARKWDLSPGYERENLHFERPIVPTCLFCHANQATHVEGTENRYGETALIGPAIGCERCHGPGAEHVKFPGPMPNSETNIVNPVNLPDPLRESVCEQCHLQGEQRVIKAGRRFDDFRPGLPLSEFLATFTWTDELGDENANAGHVEQLHRSRCYIASEGKLGCISCHDPHDLPEPDERVSFYQERCLTCHGAGQPDCALPRPTRIVKQPDDSCIACHMPRSATENIPHIATTLHQIPRNRASDPGTELPRPIASDVGVIRPGQSPLVLFHPKALDRSRALDENRDLGVALARESRFVQGSPASQIMARIAETKLAPAVEARPRDLDAREAMATVFWMTDRRDASLGQIRSILAIEPDRESSLVAASHLAEQAGSYDEALQHARHAVTISPDRSDYRFSLARLLAVTGDFRNAAAQCRAALILNPSQLDARRLLAQVELRLRRPTAARSELETLLKFDPPDRETIQRTLDAQP